MKEWAERFAEQLLRDNLKLEEFQVSLVGFQDIDKIVEHLKQLGCEVTVDRKKLRLTVVVPGGTAGKEGLIQKLKRPGKANNDQAGTDSCALTDWGQDLLPSRV